MTEFSDEELVRMAAAREMGVDLARVKVTIERLDGFVCVSVKLDGQDPTGPERERLLRYVAKYEGKEMASA